MLKRCSIGAFLGAVISGCASLGTLQQDCEAKHAAFAEMVACLRRSVEADPRSRMDHSGRVKLYLLAADDLSERVKTGRMTELQARLELQREYVSFRSAQDRGIDAAIQAMNRAQSERDAAARRTTTTDCRVFGGTMSCTTQ